jgi:integrase
MRLRLGVVKARTVQKELSALRSLFAWTVERGLLQEAPTVPKVPRRATGTAHPSGRRKRIVLSPEEMDAIVAALPERTRDGQPCRAYFAVMRETGLRPGTLQRLRAPDDYRPGAAFLKIRAEADKARYEREVPLTARAREALDEVCPNEGLIFPKFAWRYPLREAARTAGLEPDRASKVKPYDFRHSVATELTERSGNLLGVGYLLGHRHATTTNQYVHARRRAAESVLLGQNSGHRRSS